MSSGTSTGQHGKGPHIVPLSNRPVFHSPQLTAQTSHYMTPTHSRSHPSTPRPRVGDACLALLEQTAIRQPTHSVPFPGALGPHCSLQERFLELCIPASSVSSSSTPVPPPAVYEGETTARVTIFICCPLRRVFVSYFYKIHISGSSKFNIFYSRQNTTS